MPVLHTLHCHTQCRPDLEFSRLESCSRDISRPVFTSLGLGLGLEPWSLSLGLGTWDHGDLVFFTHEA